MKVPEFIPFHFDKFTMNLFKRHGAAGVGRWLLIRKAVAETDTLTIDLNDAMDRETLELDTQSTPQELTELLDHAAQRGMIDPRLYSSGILWVENLDQDMTPFYRSGKRKAPEKPVISGNFSQTLGQVGEFFHRDAAKSGSFSQTSSHPHERAFNGTERNGTERNELSPTSLENSGGEGKPIEEPKPKVEVKFVEHPNRKPLPDDLDDETKQYVELMGKIKAAVPEFLDVYGKLGSPAKIEQAMYDAVLDLQKIVPGSSDEQCIKKIISQAKLAKKAYKALNTEEKFIKGPENWLSEGCYKLPYEKKGQKEVDDCSQLGNPYLWSK